VKRREEENEKKVARNAVAFTPKEMKRKKKRCLVVGDLTGLATTGEKGFPSNWIERASSLHSLIGLISAGATPCPAAPCKRP